MVQPLKFSSTIATSHFEHLTNQETELLTLTPRETIFKWKGNKGRTHKTPCIL